MGSLRWVMQVMWKTGYSSGHGVEAGVVAEGAFAAQFAEFDVAFEDDFGVGGDFKVDGLALDDFDGLAAQEAGDHELLDSRAARGRWRRKMVAGSVPMETATSSREPLRLPKVTCGRPPMGPSGTLTRRRRTRPWRQRGRTSGRQLMRWQPRRAGLRGNARRPLSGAASACRWSGRRRPACGTCRYCACPADLSGHLGARCGRRAG